MFDFTVKLFIVVVVIFIAACRFFHDIGYNNGRLREKEAIDHCLESMRRLQRVYNKERRKLREIEAICAARLHYVGIEKIREVIGEKDS